MAPVTPHWERPSHPEIQEVIINEHNFSTKSISRVDLPPFGLFAKMTYPPCTVIDEPSYASVQGGKDSHFLLNSDLMYINHSCEPSLIFDTGNSIITAGPNGLKVGEELTFFYPSTEWHMAQPFECLCRKPTCRGRISGAKDMTEQQLAGLWLNGHIRELLEEKKQQEQQQQQQPAPAKQNGSALNGGNGVVTAQKHNGSASHNNSDIDNDATAAALRDALAHAEKVVESARRALDSYISSASSSSSSAAAAMRRGPTSRELSGEMGGDTSVAAA